MKVLQRKPSLFGQRLSKLLNIGNLYQRVSSLAKERLVQIQVLITFQINGVNDPLVPVKLQLFDNVARQLNTFLFLFQTDGPMTPFLVDTLDELIREFCAKEIMESSTTVSLRKIDFNKTANQKSVDQMDLGFAVKYDIQNLKKF